MLRFDPDGLAGGDAEELGVESVDAVEESAEPRVDLARGIRVGVVELVDVEAFLGHLADRVDSAGQHLPEGLRVGSPGESAGHGDDRDRLVGAGGRDRDRARRRCVGETEDVAEQVVGDGIDARVIHGQRRGDLTTHPGLDATAQLHRHQGVHADVEEAGVLADLVDVHPGHLGHRVTQVADQQPAALLHRRVGEALDQVSGPSRGDRRDLLRYLLIEFSEEAAPAGLLVQRKEAGPVDASHDGLRQTCGERVGEAGQRVGGRQRQDATLLQACPGLGIGHPRRCPRSEVHRGRGDAALTQGPGQPVEEGVGRPVGRLPEAAPDRGDRRCAEEEVERQVTGRFAQIPGAPDLPGEDAVELGVVLGAHRAGPDLACRVHDARQRWAIGMGCEQFRDGVCVGDVGGGDLDLATVLAGERGDARADSLAGHPTAGEHQVACTAGGKVGGDLEADRAEPAGDEIRCIGTDGECVGDRLAGAAGQPGHAHAISADRELVLADADVCPAELTDQRRPLFGGAGPQIGEAAPQRRGFERGGAAEAPQAALIR